MELICVMLDDYDMFSHSRELLDYGFTNYQKVNIVNKGDMAESISVLNGITDKINTEYAESFSIPLTAEERKTVKKTLKMPDNICAPIKKGDKVGTLEISVLGNTVKTVDIIASADAIENTYEYNLKKVLEKFFYG